MQDKVDYLFCQAARFERVLNPSDRRRADSVSIHDQKPKMKTTPGGVVVVDFEGIILSY